MINDDEQNFLNSIHTWKHNKSTNPITLEQIKSMNISKFLDVGCGDGFYGKLVRYLHPDVHMIGVEKELSYITKWKLGEIYNEIINKDIANVIGNLRGDLIVFGDVLEHLVKEDADKVIKTSVDNFSHIIINAPLGFQEQKHAIESEIHKCGLSKIDFENYNILHYEEFNQNGLMFNCFIKGI